MFDVSDVVAFELGMPEAEGTSGLAAVGNWAANKIERKSTDRSFPDAEAGAADGGPALAAAGAGAGVEAI
jgi:hypothetical protein